MPSSTRTRTTTPGTARASARPAGRRDPGPEASYSIQDAARLTGVTQHTLRWYDRIGLVPGLERSSTGRRQFTPDHLRWVVLLRTLRATGMPVAKLRELTEYHQKGGVEPVREVIRGHRAQIVTVMGLLHNSLTVLEEIEHELHSETYRAGSPW
ncbi:hypothetical protein BJF78_33500 [Pseudonocardia sp. CNS-139]|nr:hypothetical protein BJF78_33500 [Pseudonocardia sp. CNS-139]